MKHRHFAKTLNAVKHCWVLYLFLMLPVCYVIMFHYVPLFGIQIALRNYNANAGIWNSPWVGLKYFRAFFSSVKFLTILSNTLRISVYGLFANQPVAIIFALLLNSFTGKRKKKVIQTIAYMPHFISLVVAVSIVQQVTHPITGIVGIVWKALTGYAPDDVFSLPDAFPHLYVWSSVWQNFGWNSIIYMAALTAVNPELHEAAQIDGASRFQRILHVDIPTIVPTITVMFILGAGNIMSLGFEKAYLMQNGLNLRTSEIISTYVYKIAFKLETTDFSYSTAIGFFNSGVNLILIVIVNFISRQLTESSLW